MRSAAPVALLVIILLASLSPAAADSPRDKRACVSAYYDLQAYVSQLNGYLWSLFDAGKISYDEWQQVQNRNVLKSRPYLAELRRLSYGGAAQVCKRVRQRGMDVADGIVGPYTHIR